MPTAQQQQRPWRHFPHGADVGIAGYGPSLAEAFRAAAQALTAVVTDRPVRPLHRVEVRCAAPDPELLLVEWLNALVYEMAERRMLFGRFDVHISDNRLQAVAWGEPVDRGRHRPAAEVKGATYTELRVAQDDSGRWSAACVVDV